MGDNVVGAQVLLFSSCIRGIFVSGVPSSTLAVRSWLEVVKPGEEVKPAEEEDEDEEEGGPDAC